MDGPDVIFGTPRRWVWFLAPVVVGVVAWLSLVALRDREDRARTAEVKAEQMSADLEHSIRLGLALRRADDRAALERVIPVQMALLVGRAEELRALLPGDAHVASLFGFVDSAERALRMPDTPARFAALRVLGVRIIRTTNRIRAEQRARRHRAGRQTMVGSAVILLLAIVSLGVLAGMAQRRLRAVSRHHHERLERMAGEDALTGLANRRRLDEDIERLVPGAPVQLVIWDLDGFKAFNDEHGHAAGDALLGEFAAALGDTVADDGRAYRLGGDEFCVVSVPGADLTPRLRKLAGTPLSGGVTATFGAAMWPQDASAPEAALRVADTRMYAAKRQRRERSRAA